MCPSDICLSTAFSGESKACVGRLWQSTQSMVRCSPLSSCCWVGLASVEMNSVVFSIVVVVDDGDRLVREVCGNVADAGVIGEVGAVNANRTLPGASAHFQQQYVALGCVFFVIFVAGVYQQLVAGKALRPVTLLAGFARRAEACYRRRNGTRIDVERHHEKLPQARDLGPHKPRRSRTDVTFDARHV